MLSKYIDEHTIACSAIVAAANGAIATISMLESIKVGVSIAGGIMSLAIGFFTIRYLIIKTKNEQLKK